MGTHSHRLWLASLLAAGAVAVHQLRYLIAYGGHSKEALAGQGHAYLSSAGHGVVVLLALATIGFLARLAKARRVGVAEPAQSRPGLLWARATTALVLIYGFQEGLEGQIETGHPAGLAGIFGHGGWVAILLAVLVAGLVALLLRGASAAIAGAARGSRLPVARSAGLGVPPLVTRRRIAPDPVAGHLAGRGPPLISV